MHKIYIARAFSKKKKKKCDKMYVVELGVGVKIRE